MTEYVYVTPAKGGRVRMPDRGGAVMAPEGEFVPRISYYEQLIVTKDVVVDPDKKPPTREEAEPGPEPTHAGAALNNPAEAASENSKIKGARR